MTKYDIVIAGAGLAGSEAAYQLAKRGYVVKLIEMRPDKNTEAHTTPHFAELVCSNSLKSLSNDTPAGLLKNELGKYDSLLIRTAFESKVPAGAALAVDRELFSKTVTDVIKSHKNIIIERRELENIDDSEPLIIATGPLTSDKLADNLKNRLDGALYFADAISPIIDADSIDMERGYFLGRYDKGGDDYLNLALNKEEYDNFYDALIAAEIMNFHEFEDIAYFESCMPIEVMASRGRETLAFGPMRPVGLDNPKTGEKAYAVVQLRKENIAGNAYNIVGFQTKMTISSQIKVFKLIPGLENADFLRYGSVHRNTYINAPIHLDKYFKLKNHKNIFMAGQMTGVEGYLESIASGLMAALQASQFLKGEPFYDFPIDTALGALSSHVSGSNAHAASVKNYTPSNFHFGLLSPFEKKIRDKKLKKTLMSERASDLADKFIKENKINEY